MFTIRVDEAPGEGIGSGRHPEVNFTVHVCAPGNLSQFPFTPSLHGQDITEHLYIDLSTVVDVVDHDWTMHCKVQ